MLAKIGLSREEADEGIRWAGDRSKEWVPTRAEVQQFDEDDMDALFRKFGLSVEDENE